MNNKLFIPLAIIIIGVLVAGVIVYTNFSKSSNQESSNQAEEEILFSQEAADKLISFINDSILQGQAIASLIEVVEENNLYKVKFEVEGEEVEWRMTRDGNFVFPQVINLNDFQESINE